ncbi:MAG: GTP-binding protein [Gammaproteobacteria bacterium]|nr:GTP-binding protein [Gammaproteobacteria bacterium]
MIPLTVIGGYLGAGKTTILNKLLNTTENRRVAVLVNDFGSVNIDAALIANQDGPVLELTNGCVCCSVQDDLGAALEAVRGMGVDHAIIEASGVALPAKIADYGRTWPGYSLSCTLVAVDASNIARQRKDKFVGRLVDQQISQGDLLLVTKLDLVASLYATEILASLPEPHVTANHGSFPFGVFFALEPSARAYQADDTHPRFHSHTMSTDKVTTVEAVTAILDHLPPSVVRVKGWFQTKEESWLVQCVNDRRVINSLGNANFEPATQLVFISLAQQLDTELIKGSVLR